MLRVNNVYTNQKQWDVTGCLNRLPKNAVDCFVLTLSLSTSPYNIFYNKNSDITIINTCGARLQDTFCCSEFPWARERISPKIMDNLATRSQKVSQALACTDYGSRLVGLKSLFARVRVAQNTCMLRHIVNTVMNLRDPVKAAHILTSWTTVSFSIRTVIRGVSSVFVTGVGSYRSVGTLELLLLVT
jgi:hypothetical protein